jgi:hypothetical protein
MKRLWLALAILSMPAVAQAQMRYICQTPTFWCVFFAPVVAANGTPCHCNTPTYPVAGYSIADVGPPKPTPAPQQTSGPAIPPSQTGNSDDCYKGLGNCGGQYSH